MKCHLGYSGDYNTLRHARSILTIHNYNDANLNIL